MSTQTDYLRDPTLLFASGPFKGRPVNLVGMRYRIVTNDDGSEHIKFGNGSIARFVRLAVCDECKEIPNKIWTGPCPHFAEAMEAAAVESPFVCDECRPKQKNWYGPCEHAASMVAPATAADVHHREYFPEASRVAAALAIGKAQEQQEADNQEEYEKWRRDLLRPVIVPLRIEGRRPTHPCDAAYQLCIEGHWRSVNRADVGTGWHELRWLHRKLIELGRMPIPAFLEAVRLYLGG